MKKFRSIENLHGGNFIPHPSYFILVCLLLASSANDELVTGLVRASLRTDGGLAPWACGTLLASNRALRLAATMRVVSRRHGDTANVRANTRPARFARLAPRFVFMLGIADHANRCMTRCQNQARFAGRQ